MLHCLCSGTICLRLSLLLMPLLPILLMMTTLLLRQGGVVLHDAVGVGLLGKPNCPVPQPIQNWSDLPQ